MNQYILLRDKHQKMVHEFPFGFAYNNEQFDKMMEKWGLGAEDIYNIFEFSPGTYYQKKDSEMLLKLMEQIDQETKEAIASDKTGEGYIYDMFYEELANHEYCINLSLRPTLETLGLTIEEVNADPRLLHGLRKARIDYLKEIYPEEMKEAGY